MSRISNYTQAESRLVVACDQEEGTKSRECFSFLEDNWVLVCGAFKEVRPHHTALEIYIKKKLEVYKAACLPIASNT